MRLYQNQHLVKGLCALYARVRGELVRLERNLAAGRGVDAANAALETKRSEWLTQATAIETTLQLVAPDIDCAAIAPVVTTPKSGYLPYGGLRRSILRELRHVGTWMTVAELHRGIVHRHRLIFANRAAQTAHLQKAREALHALAKAVPARVERELPLAKSGNGVEQRWRLSQVFAG